MLTGESESGVSDEARSKLSAMGGAGSTARAAPRTARHADRQRDAASGYAKDSTAQALPAVSRTPPSVPAV